MAAVDKSGGVTKVSATQKSSIDTRHVAIVLRSLGGGGGAERAMLNLAAALAASGLRVDLALRSVQGHFVKDVPTTVRLVDLHARSVVSAPVAVARYLRAEHPDAVLVTGLYTNLAVILGRMLARSSTRIVVSVQNHLSVQIERSRSPFMKLVPAVAKRLFPLADAIVAVSRGVADDLSRVVGIPRESVATIHNPMVTRNLSELVAEPPAHAWLVGGGPPVVLGAGKLKPQKDFPTLLRAFALVRRERPARLLILGDGPQRSALESLARRLGVADDVTLPGFVENPYSCMARASVFVLSSAWEGLPGVLLEALACGCPVVSTDCPSGPAEILDNGVHGPLVPVGDHEALARAIVSVLDAKRESTRLISRAAEFSVEASARAYGAILFPRASEPANTIAPASIRARSAAAIHVDRA